MLFSIIANLIVIYGLIISPLTSGFIIDASNWPASQIDFKESGYLPQTPYRKNNDSLGMAVTAEAAIIVDKKSGAVLWQKNSDQARPLASITKLLTALVFLEHNPGWDKIVTMEKSDYREGGRQRLFSGEQLAVRDLFNISLVASSNDAIAALTRSTSLSQEEFVKEMNQKAGHLEMRNSIFLEPTGLEPSNLSTASDVIKLAMAAFYQKEIRTATTQEEYTYLVVNNSRKETLKNTDKLLGGYLNIQAGKTGYLEEAGYCLVSEVKGPQNQEIIIAVLGSATEADRFQDLKALAQWAFDNYIWEHQVIRTLEY